MTASFISSLLLYCFVSAITPGPANLCSFSASMQYGRKAALGQWRGILLGFAIVSVTASLVCYFLGEIFNEYIKYISWIGAAYMIFLAVKMLLALRRDDDESRKFGRPSFLTGLFVQLTNVKIMVFCCTVFTSFILPETREFKWILLSGILFPLMPFSGPACNLVWIFAGGLLQKLYRSHKLPLTIVLAASLLFCAFQIVRN